MALTTAAMLTIASTAASVIGSMSQASAAQDQADYQATVQRQQATRERQIAESEERDFRKRQSAALALRRAELGGSGVRGTTGTPLIAEEDFMSEAELQAQRIRQGGEVSATRLEQQADLTKAAGRSASQRGFMRAGSSLLTGFGEFNK